MPRPIPPPPALPPMPDGPILPPATAADPPKDGVVLCQPVGTTATAPMASTGTAVSQNYVVTASANTNTGNNQNSTAAASPAVQLHTPPNFAAVSASLARDAEDNEIALSVNLGGGHTELDVDPAIMEGGPKLDRAKKNYKIQAVTVPCSFNNTRAKISWYKLSGSSKNPMPSDDDLRVELSEYLEELALPNHHLDYLSGNKDRLTKCDCLQVFRDPAVRTVCSNWLVWSMKCHKRDEDQDAIQWVHYNRLLINNSLLSNERNKYKFLIPYMNVYPGTNSPLTDLSLQQHHLINESTLCMNGIALVIQRKNEYWRSIKSLAFSTGMKERRRLH